MGILVVKLVDFLIRNLVVKIWSNIVYIELQEMRNEEAIVYDVRVEHLESYFGRWAVGPPCPKILWLNPPTYHFKSLMIHIFVNQFCDVIDNWISFPFYLGSVEYLGFTIEILIIDSCGLAIHMEMKATFGRTFFIVQVSSPAPHLVLYKAARESNSY